MRADESAGPEARIAHLQATAGNRAVSGLLGAGPGHRPAMVQRLWPGFTWIPESGGDAKRNKILSVDQALTAFHKTKTTDYKARAAAAQALVIECAAYLKRSGRAKARTDGTKKLRAQAVAEVDLYGKLAATEQLPYGPRMTALMDLNDEAASYRSRLEHLTSASMDIKSAVGELIKQHDSADPKVLADIFAKEVAHLREIAADQAAPQIVRDIVSENLGHVDKIHFRAVEDESSGASGPGARVPKKNEDTAGKRYVLNHQLIQPGGAAERSGSFLHELTHVTTGEAFDHAPLFVIFQRGKQNTAAGRAEIKKLAITRKEKADGLAQLVRASPSLRSDQQELVVGKLTYGMGSILGKYLTNFKAQLGGPDSDEYKGLDALAKDPDIDKFDATLVEYDSVINQVVLYFHEWRVPIDDTAYELARDLAIEAQKYRRSQGGA